MTLALADLLDLDREAQLAALRAATLEDLAQVADGVLQARTAAQQANQLLYYRPASPDALKVHLSTVKHCLATGGNRSGKSETMLVDGIICMTGIIPESLKDVYPRQKIQCPMRTRLMVNSLTNTWDQTIKPKLQWNQWSGRGRPGGPYGHWGWIPPRFLIKGRWDESWLERERTLTLTCGCTMQVMSYDQDVEDMESASLHLIMNDEGPPHAIYRANDARTMDVGGRQITAMTPPDDESASWDAAWIYDELYEKGQPGPAKDPDIDSFTLFTEQNRILDIAEVQKVTRGLTAEQREVRTKGRFLHLSGRIYPTYTNRPQWWCFQCDKVTLVVDGGERRIGDSVRKRCATCGFDNTEQFCHFVEPFDRAYEWPCVYILDPHPRKDYMMAWYVVSPADDYYQVGELCLDKEPVEVKKAVDDFEKQHGLHVAKRLVDPNMAESQAHNAGRRHVTVKDELDAVGLRCALAVDDFAVGKTRVRSLLKPDPRTRQPRLHIFNTCRKTDYQMMRYVWDAWARYKSGEKNPKPTPKDLHDDFPTMLKYLANDEPTFAGLKQGTQVVHRRGSKQRGY